MTGLDVARRARLVIARELACPMRRLTDGADFRRDLGADSLDLVRVPHALEEEFGIRLSDDEVEFCKTVGHRDRPDRDQGREPGGARVTVGSCARPIQGSRESSTFVGSQANRGRVSMTLPQYRRRECRSGGRVRRLEPQQAELLALLLVSPPDRYLNLDTAIDALWPAAAAQPLTAHNIVRVRICQLRRLGIAIEVRRVKRSPGTIGTWHLSYAGWRIPPEGRACPAERERLAA